MRRVQWRGQSQGLGDSVSWCDAALLHSRVTPPTSLVATWGARNCVPSHSSWVGSDSDSQFVPVPIGARLSRASSMSDLILMDVASHSMKVLLTSPGRVIRPAPQSQADALETSELSSHSLLGRRSILEHGQRPHRVGIRQGRHERVRIPPRG